MYPHIIFNSAFNLAARTEEIIESNKCTVYGKQSEKKSRLFCKVFLVHFKQQKNVYKDCLLRVLVLALETVQRTKH